MNDIIQTMNKHNARIQAYNALTCARRTAPHVISDMKFTSCCNINIYHSICCVFIGELVLTAGCSLSGRWTHTQAAQLVPYCSAQPLSNTRIMSLFHLAFFHQFRFCWKEKNAYKIGWPLINFSQKWAKFFFVSRWPFCLNLVSMICRREKFG